MEETNDTETHRFGESDLLSGEDFTANQTVKVKVLKFLGRQKYKAKDGSERIAGFYSVDDLGVTKRWRLGIENERTLKKKFAITSYEQLVGKSLSLLVKQFPMGRGFIPTKVE